MKNNTRIAAFPTAILVIAIWATSCFLPVKGFRDQEHPTAQPHTPPRTQPQPPSTTQQPQTAPKKRGGVYHTVQRGETVFRLSKIYNVSQEDIIAANGIQDVTKIRVGQVLFIPGGKKVARVEINSNGDNPRQPPAVPPSVPPQVPPTAPPQQPEQPTGEIECKPGAVALIWPAEGKLSSTFGIRNGRQHDGVDLTCTIGTPVYASADGVVIYADRLGGYGMIVILKHEGDLRTVYAHNRKNLVQKGAVVKQGDLIAESGNSGNATGPHVHFEVRCGQDAVDPLPFLPKK